MIFVKQEDIVYILLKLVCRLTLNTLCYISESFISFKIHFDQFENVNNKKCQLKVTFPAGGAVVAQGV